MTRSHDRQESDEDVRLGIRIIQQAPVRYDSLEDQLLPPLAGSMLESEGRHTAREPLDTIVMAHRARGRENLDRVFEMMIDEDNERLLAYPFSLYSLIRPAVEAAGTAMWLIKSAKKKDRVFRALQITYRNSRDLVRFAELLKGESGGVPVRQSLSKTFDRLNQLKNTLGPLRQIELGSPPRYSAILTAISPKYPGSDAGYEISSPIVVWAMCSACLHGSDQVVRGVSDIRRVNDFTDGVASFEITPSIQMLAVSIRTCVDLIARVDERYMYLSTHNYVGALISTSQGRHPFARPKSEMRRSDSEVYGAASVESPHIS